MSDIETIKSKVDIIDLVREYVKLEQAGINWKARCPFHNEKTPSFLVSSQKQIWHCFGCNAGGDIFTFLMKAEGVEFREALKMLADRAGIMLTRRDPRQESIKNRLIEINELSRQFFGYCLNQPAGKIARDYLASRQISQQSIHDFEIGYAPNSWDALSIFLRSRGFRDQEILAAGVAVGKNSKVYDRFRHRLIFPISNIHGQTVGFSARALAPTETAKYINTPETEVYRKREVLYGLHLAKNEARKQKFIILVEGQTDVISSHTAGFANTACVSGTALTEEHVKLLKRYAETVYLCFDADSAGQNALRRGINLLSENSLSIKVITITGGKDPDEIIKKDPQLWQRAIQEASPFWEYFFTKAQKYNDLSTVEGKKQVLRDLLPILMYVADPVERSFYTKKLAQATGIDEVYIYETINKERQPLATTDNKTQPAAKPKNIKKEKSILLLALLFSFTDHLGYAADNLLNDALCEDTKEFYEDLIVYYTTHNNKLVSDDFIASLPPKSPRLSLINVLSLLLTKEFPQIDNTGARQEIIALVSSLNQDFYKEKARMLEQQIRMAENEEDDELLDKLSKELEEALRKTV